MTRVALTILLITVVFLTSGAYSAQSADETALPVQIEELDPHQSYSGRFPNSEEYTSSLTEFPHGSSPGQSVILLAAASMSVLVAMGGLIYGSRFVAMLVGE